MEEKISQIIPVLSGPLRVRGGDKNELTVDAVNLHTTTWLSRCR